MTVSQEDAYAGRSGPIVVCATDDNYVMSAAVMMYSALANYEGAEPIHFYVIDGGISESNRTRVSRILSAFSCSLEWLRPVQQPAADLPRLSWATATSYYRLFLPDLIPGTIEKVLYLDSDVLVLGDISRLWQLDVEHFYVLATPDDFIPDMAAADHLIGCPAVPEEENVEYFNAGVLVVNLAQWRQDGFSAKMWAHLRQYHQFMQYMDQDALNLAAAGRWGRLSGVWNQCVPTWERDNVVKPDPDGIIHFTGPNKPWQGTATYPARAIFDEYLRGSGWYEKGDWLRYRWRRAGHRLVSRAVDQGKKTLTRTRKLARMVIRSTAQ